MFSTVEYVFFGIMVFYAAAFIMNIIFSAKHKSLLRYITGICQAVFLTAGLILILTEQLPDSTNLLKISSISVALSFTGYFLSQYRSGKIREIIGIILIFSGTLCWYEILLPSFKLYRISVLSLTLSIILYIILGIVYLLLIFKIFSPRKELKSISLILNSIATIMACICHFASIITVIYCQKFYAIAFLIGMTALVFSLLIETAHKIRKASTKCIFLHELLLNISVLFNSTAVVLMVLL